MKFRTELLYFNEDGEPGGPLEALLKETVKVTSVHSVREALITLQQGRCAVLLCLLKDSQAEKHALLEAVRKSFSEIPVVVLSASEDTQYLLSLFRQGVFEVLRHPADPDELRQTIRKAHYYHNALRKRFSSLMEQFFHEVSTPITGILMVSRILRKNTNLMPQNEENKKALIQYLDKILKLSQRISDLIRMSKTDLVKTEYNFAREDLASIITDAISICESSPDYKNVSISSKTSAGQYFISCNALKISQVFINLIKNAFQAIREQEGSRWIDIQVSQENTHLMIRITDSGAGIPDHIAENIFKREYTTKDSREGSGLGLAFCQNVIESHGGSITYQPHEGHTSFILHLPKSSS
ncbi:MAG: HAMP domain-containing histidine kinase [Deltaproteobacteria bacterium]|nr:HAMP domain-containing histidine kinase [Deltaproteobacteria bacterium]